jgi:hypothetical protein
MILLSWGSSVFLEQRIFVRADPKGGSNALSTVRYRMDQIHLWWTVSTVVVMLERVNASSPT